jgi:hypothetical protein
VGLAMHDPLERAAHYRKQAMKCGDLAKYARPAYLGDFYRRIAVRYVLMAEEILNEARARGEIADKADRRAVPSRTNATSSERRGLWLGLDSRG